VNGGDTSHHGRCIIVQEQFVIFLYRNCSKCEHARSGNLIITILYCSCTLRLVWHHKRECIHSPPSTAGCTSSIVWVPLEVADACVRYMWNKSIITNT